MIRTRHIISLFFALFALLIGSSAAVGQSIDQDSIEQGRPISRKAIIPLYTSLHNMAKIATWADSWAHELPVGSFKVYTLKESTPWRMELYKMVKDSTFIIKLALEMGVNGTWSDSLPKIHSGQLAVIDSFADSNTVTRMIDVRDFDPSPSFYRVMGDDISAYNSFCRSQLAKVDSSIVLGRYFWGGPSALAALMHRFQMQASGCDISLWAPAHWGDSLSDGYIYLHDIERLVPYNNTLVVVTLTGEQLRALMEQTYARRFKTMKNEHSDLLRSRTPCYLHGQFQGLAHSLDVSKAKGPKVKLDRDATYRVVMNSFMARQIKTVDTVGDYRLLLTKWIINNDNKTSGTQSLEIHPHSWVRIAAEREMPMLRVCFKNIVY